MPRLPLPIKPVRLFVLTSLVTLTSCATPTISVAPTDKVACASFRPVYWSKNDTDKTIAQIKEHNAAITAICPGYTKPAKTVQPKSTETTFKDRWYEGVKTVATVFR
jgi:hypothetical protein